MTNYVGNAREQNRKYDKVIDEIKQMRKFYQDSIDELDANISGVASVNSLKISIRDKIIELDNKIKEINETKSAILKKANSLQRAEEERKRREELERQKKEEQNL